MNHKFFLFIDLKMKFFIVFVVISKMISGQEKLRIEQGEGVGKYCLSNDITPEQAQQKAILLAKKNAIEKIFGTSIQAEQHLKTDAEMDVLTKKESIKEKFSKFIIEDLKGEFLKPPTTDCKKIISQNEMCFECSVKGEMASVNTALKNSISVSALNNPNKISEKNFFIEGERFYVYFKAATDGYLTIFYLSDSNAYRILPYQKNKSLQYANHITVKADEEYIFFDVKKNKAQYLNIREDEVDELNLILDQPTDNINYNSIVVVFSKQEFEKPILSKENNNLTVPEKMSEIDFREWLMQNKLSLPNIVVKELSVTISKNKK